MKDNMSLLVVWRKTITTPIHQCLDKNQDKKFYSSSQREMH